MLCLVMCRVCFLVLLRVCYVAIALLMILVVMIISSSSNYAWVRLGNMHLYSHDLIVISIITCTSFLMHLSSSSEHHRRERRHISLLMILHIKLLFLLMWIEWLLTIPTDAIALRLRLGHNNCLLWNRILLLLCLLVWKMMMMRWRAPSSC